MKKIIFRKFTYDYFTFFLIALLSTSVIIWVFQAVNYLDIVVEDGRDYGIYFGYSLLTLPKIMSKIYPFAIFLSFYYLILRYEADNELIIFWNFGVNKITLIHFFLKISFFLFILQIILTSIITPKTQDLARSLLRNSNINFFDDFIKAKKFNDLIKDLTIYSENKDQDNNLENIYIKKKVSGGFEITFARSGEFRIINDSQYLVLFDGQNIRGNDNNLTNFSFSESSINLSDLETNVLKTIKVQENSTIDLIKCYENIKLGKLPIVNVKENFRVQNCTQQNIFVIMKELYKRLIIPIYIPILILISSFLIISSKENVNFARYKIYIFLLGFFTIIISETSLRYVQLSYSENLILILTPLVLLVSLYLFFLYNLKLKFRKYIHKKKSFRRI